MKKWTFVKPDPNRTDQNDKAQLKEYYSSKTILKVEGHHYEVYSYTIHLLTNNQEIIDDARDLNELDEPFYYDIYWADNKRLSLFECLCDTAEDVAWLFKKLSSRTYFQMSNETYLYFKKHPELLSNLDREDFTLLFGGFARLVTQNQILTDAVVDLTKNNKKLESEIRELRQQQSSLKEPNQTKVQSPSPSPSFF